MAWSVLHGHTVSAKGVSFLRNQAGGEGGILMSVYNLGVAKAFLQDALERLGS